MQRNTIILLILLILVIGGVFFIRQNEMNKKSTTPVVSVTPEAMKVIIYEGDLPCADCEGIDVVLTLNTDNSYSMSNTYRGRDVEPYVEKGTWRIVKGDATNPNAEVYQLTPSDTGSIVQNYLLSGNELKQLDTNLQLIEAPFNTSLTKKTQ